MRRRHRPRTRCLTPLRSRTFPHRRLPSTHRQLLGPLGFCRRHVPLAPHQPHPTRPHRRCRRRHRHQHSRRRHQPLHSLHKHQLSPPRRLPSRLHRRPRRHRPRRLHRRRPRRLHLRSLQQRRLPRLRQHGRPRSLRRPPRSLRRPPKSRRRPPKSRRTRLKEVDRTNEVQIDEDGLGTVGATTGFERVNRGFAVGD